MKKLIFFDIYLPHYGPCRMYGMWKYRSIIWNLIPKSLKMIINFFSQWFSSIFISYNDRWSISRDIRIEIFIHIQGVKSEKWTPSITFTSIPPWPVWVPSENPRFLHRSTFWWTHSDLWLHFLITRINQST